MVQLVVPLTVATSEISFRTREDLDCYHLDTAKAMANRGGFNSVAERKSSTRTHAAETSQLYRMGTKEEKLKEAMYITVPAALRSAGKGGEVVSQPLGVLGSRVTREHMRHVEGGHKVLGSRMIVQTGRVTGDHHNYPPSPNRPPTAAETWAAGEDGFIEPPPNSPGSVAAASYSVVERPETAPVQRSIERPPPPIAATGRPLNLESMRLAERGLDEDGTLIRAERVPFMPAALLRPPSKAQYFVACNPEVIPAAKYLRGWQEPPGSRDPSPPAAAAAPAAGLRMLGRPASGGLRPRGMSSPTKPAAIAASGPAPLLLRNPVRLRGAAVPVTSFSNGQRQTGGAVPAGMGSGVGCCSFAEALRERQDEQEALRLGAKKTYSPEHLRRSLAEGEQHQRAWGYTRRDTPSSPFIATKLFRPAGMRRDIVRPRARAAAADQQTQQRPTTAMAASSHYAGEALAAAPAPIEPHAGPHGRALVAVRPMSTPGMPRGRLHYADASQEATKPRGHSAANARASSAR